MSTAEIAQARRDLHRLELKQTLRVVNLGPEFESMHLSNEISLLQVWIENQEGNLS